jgi:hypothetical protein
MYASIFSLLSPWTYGRVALYYTCYHRLVPLSLTHGLTAALPCTYIRYALDPVSFLRYLCFTYRLRAGPKPSFPFVYKLVDYHVVLYFNLTWFYLKPSRFS